MPADFWIPLTTFALVAAFTPGPNNLMLATSGMNHGFRRSVPHMAGISLGFPLMLLAVIFGVGALITQFPALRALMRLLSAAFIVYFAWRIATTETDMDVQSSSRPFTMWQAALFQWVNPKGWAVAIAVASLYAPGGIEQWERALMMAGLFFLVTVACTSCWASLGMAIRRLLQDPGLRRWVNRAMAAALVLTMLPIIMGDG